MMKRTLPIFAKYCGRAFSTIASSSLASSVKHRWGEQESLGLWVTCLGGFSFHLLTDFYKRREHWYKVQRMREESDKRDEDLFKNFGEMMDDLKMKP